ncbi:MAG: bifunctional oligoribonuclease/PAP phosphatase NrnA [Ruminococcus sp.]|nr:bifunctional oligoribonuclease/PAP phosphatase NrnA [Ruminococcus sp.]
MDFSGLVRFFDEHDNFLILTHKNPDGDTIGCGFGLCFYLREIGKKANVVNNDSFPARYDFLYDGYCDEDIDYESVIAVDIADTQLLGDNLSEYAKEGMIDVCIDHHISNKHYAKETYLDGKASAACLVLYDFFKEIGAKISDHVAKCLYTGIATDTGCFKFENTTPEAHRAAADLMSYDIDFANVNRLMFDIKSRGRLAVEQSVAANMEYYFDDRCAMIVLTKELMDSCGVDETEFEGLASLPLQVEGVKIGITVKQREDKLFKLSVRTNDEIDACKFCMTFNGGGHIRAAGCDVKGDIQSVKEQVLPVVKETLDSIS